MNKLEDYRSKRAEIKELREKIDNLESEAVVSDTVNDYRKGYAQPISVTGIDTKRLSSMRSRYIMQAMRLSEECSVIEEQIDNIEDSLLRRIIRMYFVDGYNQQLIAHKVHIDQSAVSRKIKKYLDNTKEGE